MPNFEICYTISEDGRIVVVADSLEEAKAKVDEMRFVKIRRDGTLDDDRIRITDGWPVPGSE